MNELNKVWQFLFGGLTLLCPLLATAATPSVLNPNRELKPSYEYEDSRPVAIPSGHYIATPPFETVPYEVVVAADYDEVLARIQANIANTAFALNTVNVKMGLISCALQTETPETYVDLGTTTRIFNQEEFIFPTAASMVYKLPYVNNNSDFYIVKRATTLNCLATLQLKKVNASETKLSVNISYMFTLYTSYENTAFRKKAPPSESVTINFMTNIEQKLNLGNAGDPAWVTPQSKGVLESMLLDMAL